MFNFKVFYGRRCQSFIELQDAIIFAREKALGSKSHPLVEVWNSAGVVIGVVTSDMNGLTVHRLVGWPEDVVCAYE